MYPLRLKTGVSRLLEPPSRTFIPHRGIMSEPQHSTSALRHGRRFQATYCLLWKARTTHVVQTHSDGIAGRVWAIPQHRSRQPLPFRLQPRRCRVDHRRVLSHAWRLEIAIETRFRRCKFVLHLSRRARPAKISQPKANRLITRSIRDGSLIDVYHRLPIATFCPIVKRVVYHPCRCS